MKKLMSLMLICAMATSMLLAGCTSNNSNTDANTQKKKIGIIQLVEHDALDAANAGFIQALADAGYVDDENIEIIQKNAQGELSNCATIATQLVNEKCDLILAIATPAAQAVANATTDIPILITAVTDPLDAGLIKDYDTPGTNVSGTSDLTPVDAQFQLLKDLLPDAANVGLLYNSGESNSVVQINLAKKAAEAQGLTYIDATVSESSELRTVVESLNGKVDVIYAPTDNMIANGMATVAMVANELGLPVIVGEPGMCENGGLATYGINYFDLGIQTGKMAAEVLGGADISTMSIQYLAVEGASLLINEDTAAILDITIPDSLKDEAELIQTKSE